jgi:hypothetical protein
MVAGAVDVVFGVLGGFYVLRALMALHHSPEMWKTQRNIWLPILIGGVFFIVSGLLHFSEHSYFSGFSSGFEMDLLRDVFNTVGFSLVTVGVIRDSQLQIKYYKLKREALQRISKEHNNKIANP